MERPAAVLGFVGLASGAVVAVSLLAAFRMPFAGDAATLVAANGPRVLLGAGAGAALALSGAIRLDASGAKRAPNPLSELEILGISTGAAAGGYLLAGVRHGSLSIVLFAAGAVAVALALRTLVRALDTPQRSANLAVAVALAGMAGLAAFAGTYARARRDAVAPAVAWLLGDLSGATFASGAAVLAGAAVLVAMALRAPPPAGARSPQAVALLALGLGVGAAGPLAFVGTLPALAVRALARGASPRGIVLATAGAGAAAVVAIDAVPRLLFGGYDFPWNVPGAMAAIPVYLAWNRARLRREVGRAGVAFEVLEVGVIAALTLGAVALAWTLTRVVRAAT